MDLHVQATTYTVCALPLDHRAADAFAVRVEWRGGDRWAVTRRQMCLDADGEWDWEPAPSSRDEAWLETHRFDLDAALRLAKAAAPDVVENGYGPADVARG